MACFIHYFKFMKYRLYGEIIFILLGKKDCKCLYVKRDFRQDFTAGQRSMFHLIHHVVLTTITILQRNIHSRYLSILLGKVFA